MKEAVYEQEVVELISNYFFNGNLLNAIKKHVNSDCFYIEDISLSNIPEDIVDKINSFSKKFINIPVLSGDDTSKYETYLIMLLIISKLELSVFKNYGFIPTSTNLTYPKYDNGVVVFDYIEVTYDVIDDEDRLYYSDNYYIKFSDIDFNPVDFLKNIRVKTSESTYIMSRRDLL